MKHRFDAIKDWITVIVLGVLVYLWVAIEQVARRDR